jgi:hypothetical protein
MPKRMTIQVRVTNKEFSVLTLIAEQRGLTVSQVVREKLFTPETPTAATTVDAQPRTRGSKASGDTEHAIVAHIGSGRETEGAEVEGITGGVERLDTRAPRKVVAGKTCVHGTPKGYRCWRCGGMAATT